ncbi:uncharacterized protein LOC117786531 [Drosophila innubila]|uniref:uncharacterized protein LOC117786531 n=1 Tax=Drosophila innubila TaxID=198719 RepID=UPI00148C3C4D|nr:uncharacterized protein LOC117786531 [Drosophila innubila]
MAMAPAAQKKLIDSTSTPKRKTRAKTKADQIKELLINNNNENAANEKSTSDMLMDSQKKASENGHDQNTAKAACKLRTRKKQAAKSDEDSESDIPKKLLKKSSKYVDDEASKQNTRTRGTRTRKKQAPKSEDSDSDIPKKSNESFEDEASKVNTMTRTRKKQASKSEDFNSDIPKKISRKSLDEAAKKNPRTPKLTIKVIKKKAVPINDLNNSNGIETKEASKKYETIECNNNNNNYIHVEQKVDEFKKGELLEALCFALAEPPEMEPETGYTHDDLKQFLLNSTIKDMFPFAFDIKSTTEIFQRLNSAIYKLEEVQLDQLLDLYHLAIMMQTYEHLDTHMNYRHELLDAVGELSVELKPIDIEYIGSSLCDRFVIGSGMTRMQKVVDMHNSIVIMIGNSDVNYQIAMTTLLATFAKVSGVNFPKNETDIIKKAFEMAKLVEWMQLVESGREADMFVLVRCFSLIINTKQNRDAHLNWHQELGSEIHTYFMKILRTVRFSTNYNFFAMMIERFIAFCVVRGATARAFTTDVI